MYIVYDYLEESITIYQVIMINYLIEKYFTLLKGVAYFSASSESIFDLYEFDKPEQLKNLNK
jgi:hypothetical protein